jgi:hypothetical protein
MLQIFCAKEGDQESIGNFLHSATVKKIYALCCMVLADLTEEPLTFQKNRHS